MAARPRSQEKVVGKQEGTPKRARGRKKKMSNINDKMRHWQNTLDGGGADDLRRALGEATAQVRALLSEAKTSAEGQREAIDPTASHYLEMCATVDMLKANMKSAEQAGRRTMSLTTLKKILEAGRDA